MKRQVSLRIAILLFAVVFPELPICSQTNSVKPISGLNLDSLSGTWTLRLFQMDANPNTTPKEVVFGCWKLKFQKGSGEEFEGGIEKDGWRLPVTGNIPQQGDSEINFTAGGTVANENWNLTCVGLVAPEIQGTKNPIISLIGTGRFSRRLSGGSGIDVNSATKHQDLDCHWIAIKQAGSVNSLIEWSLPTYMGGEVDSTSFVGKPTLLIFSQGFSCLHCNQQIQLFKKNAEQFLKRECNVVFIVADSDTGLKAATKGNEHSFLFLADSVGSVFLKFGLDRKHSTHGIFVLDHDGLIHWSSTGNLPFQEMPQLLEKIDQVISNRLIVSGTAHLPRSQQ